MNMSNLKIIYNGNIFVSDCEILVNPVNCIRVMGKGLIKEFKLRYPEMFKNIILFVKKVY